jgi:hypothetical protein
LYAALYRAAARLPFRRGVREKMQFNLREIFEVRRGVTDAAEIAAYCRAGAFVVCAGLVRCERLSAAPLTRPAVLSHLLPSVAGWGALESLHALSALDDDTLDLLVRPEDRSGVVGR